MITVRVAEIVDETPSIRSFRLIRCDGAPLGPYTAGAHIDVTGPTGITRQYSLCGEAADSYLIAVKREEISRGGSVALHERVAVGSELAVSEPRNRFGIVPEAGRHILVAAGIGITPLLSMAHQLHRDGKSFRLHYFARTREQAAFTSLLEQADFADRVHFHFGVPRHEQQSTLNTLFSDVDGETHVYTCGPKEFMHGVAETVTLPAEQLHAEQFQAMDPPAEPGAEFELELDTGEVFTIPADRSVVDVLAEHGFPIDTSCREGICGTCVLPVLDGEPDHRDNCLTRSEKAANDQMAVCVSRARSRRLVIEL